MLHPRTLLRRLIAVRDAAGPFSNPLGNEATDALNRMRGACARRYRSYRIDGLDSAYAVWAIPMLRRAKWSLRRLLELIEDGYGPANIEAMRIYDPGRARVTQATIERVADFWRL